MKQLLLATRNKDKIDELLPLLAGIDMEVLTLSDFPQISETVEDADSFEGNALKKAREAFVIARIPTLADDSGLEVHYLNREPGVYSSRYAGPNARYADNCKKLLEKLRGVPPRRRAARFRCVVAFIPGDGVHHLAEGTCPGVITESPRGNGGFGYDPIFLPTGYRATFAEMNFTLKNTLSHRAKAIQNIMPTLRRLSEATILP